MPALATSAHARTLKCLRLVGPASALLSSAVARVQDERPTLPVRALSEELGAFSAKPGPDDGNHRWDLARARFAPQAIPEPERWDGLARLRAHVKRLVIVEFDVPASLTRTDEHLQSLATRYERALGEYEGATSDLVAPGFLIPMFLGQIDVQTAATNWEHPAPVCREKLQSLGWRVTRLAHISNYFWAPTFVLVAEA